MPKTKTIFLGAALLLGPLAACDDTSVPLQAQLAGTWIGTTWVTLSDGEAFSYPTTLIVAASGESATVSGLCPDGSGALVAQGGGPLAQWSGSLQCPSSPFGACGSAQVSFASASVSLQSGRDAGGLDLEVHADGASVGCDETSSALVSFEGAQP